MRTLYKIVYPLRNVTQIKELIDEEEFIIYSFYKNWLRELDSKKPSKSQKEELVIWNEKYFKIKKWSKQLFPHEIFVVGSPLHDSMRTGLLTVYVSNLTWNFYHSCNELSRRIYFKNNEPDPFTEEIRFQYETVILPL